MPLPDRATAADLATLLGDSETPTWQDRALCAQVGDDFWFPEKGGSTRLAKRVCAGCEVRAECLAHALANPDDGRFGVWGGTTPAERDQLARAATSARLADLLDQRPAGDGLELAG